MIEYNGRKYKIQLGDITYGSTRPSLEEAMQTANELTRLGYRRTSNAYCMVSRIDREDWLNVLAKERNCSRADFYNVDGTGIADSHRDYYIRVHSKDNHTIHPAVFVHMKGY